MSKADANMRMETVWGIIGRSSVIYPDYSLPFYWTYHELVRNNQINFDKLRYRIVKKFFHENGEGYSVVSFSSKRHNVPSLPNWALKLTRLDTRRMGENALKDTREEK